MTERSTFLSTSFCPASRRSLAVAFAHSFGRDIIDPGCAFATVGEKFIGQPLFFKKLVITCLANFWHDLTFLVGGFSKRVLILPFRCVNIREDYALSPSFEGDFECDFNLKSADVYRHFPPFYRRLFNLLPLLLYFYYITLACIESRGFSDFLQKFSIGKARV